MERLEHKVAVVTGASKGIGAATAKRLLAEGARVALLDIVEAGKELTADSNASYYHCDVSQHEEIKRVMGTVIEDMGEIDVLINNAGIQHYGTVVSTPEEEWDQVMAINLKSAYLCAKHVVPSMQRAGGGTVINVASVQSFHSQRNVAPYATGKAALLGLTRSIAVDFAPEIRSVAVCPGTVDTPMVRHSAELSGDPDALYEEVERMHLSNRIASADEIAGLIAYLCTDEASFITGQAIRIDGGLGVLLSGTVEE